MRAYTVIDLDALRSAVRSRELWGSYRGPSRDRTSSVSYNETEMTKIVEETVRTHMIAGHTASDLINSEAT
ncbi:hypothetical protein ASD85_16835 [Rhizobium sp. Root651]|nr:hypothetical protein ASD85_16835 [Rhizobium sp. Root651]